MKSRTLMDIAGVLLFPALLLPVRLAAQELGCEALATSVVHPVPLINQPLVPGAARPGGAGFVLTVNGTGFVSGSVVHWNGSPRATTFESQSRLTASILASDIAKAGSSRVTVISPGPAGGTSNVVFFETTRATSSVALSTSMVRVGSSPTWAAVGDFNGDGKLDLAVANAGSKSVSVLLGNGDGTFKVPLNFGAPAPQSVAVGDFNGDGKLDLVVANLASGNVSIRLGNGDGTFRAPVNYATGDSPNTIAVGDFNGDGKLDLAVVNGGNDTGVSSVSILLGNGNGTFHAAGKYPVSFGNSIAVGDFNRDGKLDLAVASFGDSSASVFLGNGDGTFQTAVDYSADNASTSVAVGDFNGDGKLDLAVANIVSNSGLGDVSVLLGNGDGTFKPAVNYGAGSNPSAVAVGDFNGDGKLDLAVANYGGYGNVASVSVLLGNGNGTFQPATEYVGVGSFPPSLAVGDFNSDGRIDMAVANPGNSTVAVLLQPRLVSGLNAILEPTNVTFAATQLVGTTSPVLPIQLSNYGTMTLSIAGITTSSDFSQTHNCGSSVAPGASCTVDVALKPTQGGAQTGTLSVTDDAPGSPHTVSLNGTSTVVELNPPSLSFGCVTLCLGPLGCHCYCSQPRTTTLTNVGQTALDITDITITGPFSLGNTCPVSVGAGQSCTLTVDWLRTTGGGEISVNDNGGGSPQNVSLFGEKRCSP